MTIARRALGCFALRRVRSGPGERYLAFWPAESRTRRILGRGPFEFAFQVDAAGVVWPRLCVAMSAS
jgi:hypothetical protein